MKAVGMKRVRFQNPSRAKFTKLDMRYVELYPRMNFRRCLHVEISSLRLFRVAMCGLVIRKKLFIVLQTLQRFVRFVYGFAFTMIFNVTVNSLLSSFSFHRCLLSSVLFLLFTCLNDIWWSRYLALNWFAVRPMYVSCASGAFTMAWYTTSLTRHSPSSGQSSFFLQLHVFFLSPFSAVVLFLRSAVWLRYGHLLIAWRRACSCSWVSGCFCWIFSSACGP